MHKHPALHLLFFCIHLPQLSPLFPVFNCLLNFTSHSHHFFPSPNLPSFGTLNAPPAAYRVSSVRSCWALMYEPLIDSQYEFHHTWQWSLSSCSPSENGSLFLYDPYKQWFEGGHDARERKKASEILFGRLSSALNVTDGCHSEMKSTTASDWHK